MDDGIQHYNDDWFDANPEDIREYNDVELKLALEKLLQKGEDNALKMRQIKERLRYSNDRKIRLTIEAMRQSKEHIILSSNKGYWYSASPNEARKWSEYMKSYIKDISHTTKLVEEAAVKEYGEKYFQIPMFN